VFAQLAARGKTWRNYSEDMPSNCYKANTPLYAARHNPSVYYSGLRDCAQNSVPMGDFRNRTGRFASDVSSGSLPNLAFVTPNLINDTHNAAVAAGDAWLKSLVSFVTAGPNYRAGDTAIVITNDEGCGGTCGRDYRAGEDCHDADLATHVSCHIPAFVVAPFTPAARVNTSFSHYSLLRTLEEMFGLPLLGHAADRSTASMAAAFHLPVGR
jgi:acid phosphatase